MGAYMDLPTIQRLIIAGNALEAALDPDFPTSEENLQRMLDTWKVAVDSVREKVQRPRTVWVKRSTQSRRMEDLA